MCNELISKSVYHHYLDIVSVFSILYCRVFNLKNTELKGRLLPGFFTNSMARLLGQMSNGRRVPVQSFIVELFQTGLSDNRRERTTEDFNLDIIISNSNSIIIMQQR